MGAARGRTTAAAAWSCPGVLDDGVVRYAANLPWRDEPVRDRLADALGLPVVLGRDVAAAALAESAHVHGADVLFVALGTGIAAAHVVGGAVRGGATGRAGEIGHVPRPSRTASRAPAGSAAASRSTRRPPAIARRYAARAASGADAAQIAAATRPSTRTPPPCGTRRSRHSRWPWRPTTLANDPAVDRARRRPGAGRRRRCSTRCAGARRRLAWRPAPPLDRRPRRRGRPSARPARRRPARLAVRSLNRLSLRQQAGDRRTPMSVLCRRARGDAAAQILRPGWVEIERRPDHLRRRRRAARRRPGRRSTWAAAGCCPASSTCTCTAAAAPTSPRAADGHGRGRRLPPQPRHHEHAGVADGAAGRADVRAAELGRRAHPRRRDCRRAPRGAVPVRGPLRRAAPGEPARSRPARAAQAARGRTGLRPDGHARAGTARRRSS